MILCNRVNLPKCLRLSALVAVAVVWPGQAGEPPPKKDEPSPRLRFSSSSSLDALLPSNLNEANARLRPNESRGSLGDMLRDSGGSVPVAPRTPSTRSNRSPNDWTRGLSQEESWLTFESESGRPTASAYERAAGVRDYSAALRGTSESEAPTEAATPDTGSAPSLIMGSGSDPRSLNSLQTLPSTTRSLDPLLPDSRGLPLDFSHRGAPALVGTGLNLDSALPQTLNPASPTSQTGLGLRGNPWTPFDSSQWVNSRSPRTVRELIQDAQASSADRSSSELRLLDQDATRTDLHPYLPQRREDFQFSSDTVRGDARLGINARTGSSDPYASPSPLRSLSAQSRSASSLAPALALPMSSAPASPSRSLGKGSQYQLPSRRF